MHARNDVAAGRTFALKSYLPSQRQIDTSIESLREYRRLFLDNGYASVTIQSTLDPDVDFCTLVNAKHVVLSGFGFGNTVQTVRKIRGRQGRRKATAPHTRRVDRTTAEPPRTAAEEVS